MSQDRQFIERDNDREQFDSGSTEKARVIAVENEFIWVESFQKSTCGDCEAKAACGQGSINRWFGRKSHCFPVSCEKGQAQLYTVGQWVDVAVPEGAVMRASLLAYILPLAAMIGVGSLMSFLYNSDFAVLLGLVSGLLLGLLAVRYVERIRQNSDRYCPRLLGLHSPQT